MGKQWKQWLTILGAPKSPQMVTAAMKLKRCLLLGRKVMINLSSVQFSSFAQSGLTLCNRMNCSMPGLHVHHNSQSSLRFTSTESVMPSSYLILCCPFFFCPQSLPVSKFFPMSQLFAWDGQSTGVLALAYSFKRTPRADLLQNGLVGSPCNPRDSQETSPMPQFKSINSLALSFLYSPTLTSIHDYWKNHSLDYMDLCWQSNVSAF